MPRFAANLTMLFTELPFLDRFHAAREAGFRAVEYLFPYEYPAEAVRDALQAAELAQALFNLPPGDWDGGDRGLASLPSRQEEFRASLRLALDYARIIMPEKLHMMAGIAPSNDPAAIACYRDNLARAADAAGQAGFGLTIEPINGRDMPGYFLDDFDRAVDIIQELDRSNLSLQFDIYHRQIMRGDVLTALREMISHIGHIQIAAVPTRHEPTTGELNDARLLEEIDALGYTGHVGCEYRPARGTREGLGWIAAWL